MSRNKLSLLQLIPIIFIGVLIIYVLNPISFTNSMNDVNVYQTSILKSTFQQDYREKVEEIKNDRLNSSSSGLVSIGDFNHIEGIPFIDYKKNNNEFDEDKINKQNDNLFKNIHFSSDGKDVVVNSKWHIPSNSIVTFYGYNVTDNKLINGQSKNTSYYTECVWWAYGRGWQLHDELNWSFEFPYSNQIGHGYMYYDCGAKFFNTGKKAKKYSWISWKGGNFGHVAFVEDVLDDGTILISQNHRHAGEDYSTVELMKIKNTGTEENPNYIDYNNQVFQGFVYIDEPKIK